jgi:hypothetical protein
MATDSCCSQAARSKSALALRSVGWIGPGALLVFVPKCPACFAAYFAMATGMGLSLTVATYMRSFLVFFSSALLVFAATRFVLNAINRLARSSNLSTDKGDSL